MTGLQVWVHPSSRTLDPSLIIRRLLRAFLHSTPLWWTAAVVRDRSRVFNVAHLDTGRGQSANGGFTSRTRAADPDLDAAHTVIARHYGRVRCGLLGGEWCALARSAESERAGTLPGEYVSGLIGNGDNGVVERSLDVRNAVGNVLALLLLKRLFLAFFLCRRGAACCCWFCHSKSSLVVGRLALGGWLPQGCQPPRANGPSRVMSCSPSSSWRLL